MDAVDRLAHAAEVCGDVDSTMASEGAENRVPIAPESPGRNLGLSG